jgi:hypothetical protein
VALVHPESLPVTSSKDHDMKMSARSAASFRGAVPASF